MFMYGGKMFSNLILKRRSNADCLTMLERRAVAVLEDD